MRGTFREYFVTIVLRCCPLCTPGRSSVELRKLSLVNSLFHFFESLIAHIQAGSDEIAEAEKRLNFELYGVHPFRRPSATSNQSRQADANNLESFLTSTIQPGARYCREKSEPTLLLLFRRKPLRIFCF